MVKNGNGSYCCKKNDFVCFGNIFCSQKIHKRFIKNSQIVHNYKTRLAWPGGEPTQFVPKVSG